jgi:hypothetical protein
MQINSQAFKRPFISSTKITDMGHGNIYSALIFFQTVVMRVHETGRKIPSPGTGPGEFVTMCKWCLTLWTALSQAVRYE